MEAMTDYETFWARYRKQKNRTMYLAQADRNYIVSAYRLTGIGNEAGREMMFRFMDWIVQNDRDDIVDILSQGIQYYRDHPKESFQGLADEDDDHYKYAIEFRWKGRKERDEES